MHRERTSLFRRHGLRRRAGVLFAGGLAGTFAAGCGESPTAFVSGVRVEVAATAVATDDSIVVTVRNESRGDVTVQSCAVRYEEASDGQWRDAAGQPGFCTHDAVLSLMTIRAGESVVFREPVKEWMSLGEYRVYVWFWRAGDAPDGARARVWSSPFRVGAP